jgi:hypothetical protein
MNSVLHTAQSRYVMLVQLNERNKTTGFLANMSQLTSQRLSSAATYKLIHFKVASLDGKNRLGHFIDASVTALKSGYFHRN